MALILGYSAHYHDSAAAIVRDGQVIAAVAEERLSRVKHDASFPIQAIEYCLNAAGAVASDLDAVVFYEKPFTKFDRILDTHLKRSPRSFMPFQRFVGSWLREKFWVEDQFKRHFKTTAPFSYYRHHLAHVASLAVGSGLQSAAFVVIDGVGERACTSYGVLQNGQLRVLGEQYFPHSIGLLYSAFTQYCGFKVNSGEYKLMGLAPYGKPIYKALIYEHFVQSNEHGEVTLKTENFGFLDGLSMLNRKFQLVFGKKARNPDADVSDFFKDIAASIQLVTEELVIGVFRYVHAKTGEQTLLYGGGVALNCVANATILEQTPFKEVRIHSAAGDSGCALGAALWKASEINSLSGLTVSQFLGPSYSDQHIEEALNCFGLNYEHYSTNAELFQKTSKLLSQHQIVGWFQGAMEYGPRALGNRSILADPTVPDMQSILNHSIKKREGFRPFAPVILDHCFNDYFVDAGYDYSQMLYTAQSTEKARQIPACIHVDGSARVQRLKRMDNAMMYDLLEAFYTVSGCPVLINTSLNERGEPMVCSPTDAIQCFLNTEMDILVMGHYCVKKQANESVVAAFNKRSYAAD